ncbi:hypothetical protein H0H93_010135 [Arthromyces matolae]|nr:hypothetical protein H0H93_010135 [Arthromyces matolae]
MTSSSLQEGDATVVSDLLDEGLSFEMKMTRDFVCLPADLIDPDEAFIDKPATSDSSSPEAQASQAFNTNVEQWPSASKQPPPVSNSHADLTSVANMSFGQLTPNQVFTATHGQIAPHGLPQSLPPAPSTAPTRRITP